MIALVRYLPMEYKFQNDLRSIPSYCADKLGHTDGRVERQTDGGRVSTTTIPLWPYGHRVKKTVVQTTENLISGLWRLSGNKANLRDLIAAIDLIILLKLDSSRPFFNLCDFENFFMDDPEKQ